MSTAPHVHWFGLLSTHPGEGFYVRWRTRERSADTHPPTLVGLHVGEHACAAVDLSDLDCIVIEQPFRPLEVEVIPSGVARFTMPTGTLDAGSPDTPRPLAAHLAFIAPDGTPALEGEDYEVLRVPSLRAMVVEDAEANGLPDDDDA